MDPLLREQMPRLLDELSEHGWVATAAAFDLAMCRQLAEHLQGHLSYGTFVHAGVGFGQAKSRQDQIRNDQILWWEAGDKNPSVRRWVQEMSDLGVALNEHLFLSINSYDCHYACYQAGSFYKKHLDRFRDESGRLLSVILFLNEHWVDSDGGQLLIYDPLDSSRLVAEISPEIGTLVIFRSELVLHEVRTTKRRRISVTGWFKSLEAQPMAGEGHLLSASHHPPSPC